MRTIQDFSQTYVCEDRKHHKGCDSQQERLFPERCDVLNSDMHHFHLCIRQETPPSRLNYCD